MSPEIKEQVLKTIEALKRDIASDGQGPSLGTNLLDAALTRRQRKTEVLKLHFTNELAAFEHQVEQNLITNSDALKFLQVMERALDIAVSLAPVPTLPNITSANGSSCSLGTALGGILGILTGGK